MKEENHWRVDAIDDLRGFAIFTMFVANFIALLCAEAPLLLQHARHGQALPFDFVAPLFGFSMGLSLPFTRTRSRRFAKRVGRRVIGLFLIGYIPDLLAGYKMVGDLPSAALSTWGILETWALAYGLAAASLALPIVWRLTLSGAMVCFHQTLLSTSPEVVDSVSSLREGGPVAVLGWAALAVGATVVIQLYLRLERRYWTRLFAVSAAVLAVAATAAHFAISPADRMTVNGAYLLAGGAVCLTAFLIFAQDGLGPKEWFREIGRHPLLAWLLQGVIYVPVYATVGLQHFSWPAGGILAAAAVAVTWHLTSFLTKRGVRVRL